MSEDRKPILLDLEDPIARALGVAAALYASQPDNEPIDGIDGAYQVLYSELREIKRLYYAIHAASQGGAS